MDFFPVLKCSETLTANRSALSPSIHSQGDIEGAVVGDEDLVFVPSDAGWGVARSNAFQGHSRQPTHTTHPTAVFPYHRWDYGCKDWREKKKSVCYITVPLVE